MVGEWGRMVGMKRDGTHIVVDALQSSLSLQSRSTMHSTFESAEARLLCYRALLRLETKTGLLLLSLLLKSLARFGYVGCKDLCSRILKLLWVP